MARHAKYPRRPRRVASERLYTGGTRSVASALERRCSACADLAKTDVATTPGIPGYATIGLCQGAGICAAPRGREGRAPARPDAHQHGPAREVPAPPSARGAVGCLPPIRFLAAAAHFYKNRAGANHVYVKERPEVSRGYAKHLRNGRGASFPAIGVSILPEKKEGGTDGTDTACGGHRWYRSYPSVRGGSSIGVHLCRRSRSRHSLPHFKMRFQCVINPITNQDP